MPKIKEKKKKTSSEVVGRLWVAGCNMWIQQRTSLGMDTSWESGNVLEVGMLITMDG